MQFKQNAMRFGIFMGPYHKTEMNPLISFQQDMNTIINLDRLGFDEAWIGEHHSGGIETIASPELMIAAAAERTSRIKLGTGAITIPYHHPFMVADRMVQLDYMTRGRMMFGVAPGQLLKDAQMIGIDPKDSRRKLHEAMDVIIPLFKGETITCKKDWFELKDAKLNLLPFSNFDMAMVGAVSPSGPLAAGKYGTGLISVAATDPVGVEKLLEHWEIVERESKNHGHVADRKSWRLLGPMHLAETFEQAKEEVRYGLTYFESYRARVNPTPPIDWDDFDGVVDLFNESGAAVIGTPEMARNQINRLIQKSGGFGTYLIMGVDWAPYEAQMRSLQLFAEQVIPHFNGTLEPLQRGYDEVIASGFAGAEVTAAAQKTMSEIYKGAK